MTPRALRRRLPKLVQTFFETARQAGVQALHERDYRRMGLGFSLAAIGLTLIGLRLVIKEVDRKRKSS